MRGTAGNEERDGKRHSENGGMARHARYDTRQPVNRLDIVARRADGRKLYRSNMLMRATADSWVAGLARSRPVVCSRRAPGVSFRAYPPIRR